jgi:hypothetical protein
VSEQVRADKRWLLRMRAASSLQERLTDSLDPRVDLHGRTKGQARHLVSALPHQSIYGSPEMRHVCDIARCVDKLPIERRVRGAGRLLQVMTSCPNRLGLPVGTLMSEFSGHA